MKSQFFRPHARVIVIFAVTLLISACSVDVKKDANGKEKNVQIDTPVGHLHVSEDAKASDTGLPVYPGARVLQKENDGDNKSANVNILTGFFGLKVVAVEYETDDAVEKVKDYYQGQLKKYGNVLVCRTSADSSTSFNDNDSKSQALVCEQNSGNNFELKAGIRDNQHIVSIESRDKGCKFSLVYLQMHGKETTI